MARYVSRALEVGVPTAWRDTTHIFPGGPTTVFSDRGFPSFLIEIGGGQPLEAFDIAQQSDAVLRFLRAVGVVQGAREPRGAATLVQGYRVGTSTRGGFLDASCVRWR